MLPFITKRRHRRALHEALQKADHNHREALEQQEADCQRYIESARFDAVRAHIEKHKSIPITNVAPNDILVVGYPRSGNTWTQIMIASILFKLDPINTPFSLICEAVPDLSDVSYFKRHNKTMFFKSHALPMREYRRVVYIVRDGRDVVVSYRHFREVLDKREYALEEFVRLLEDKIWPCAWNVHVDQWAENPFNAEFMLVRYEDLKLNTISELERIFRFSGIVVKEDEIRRVVDAASMTGLREKEKREGAIPIPLYKGGKPFFRRGKIGSHKDEMSNEALQIFLRRAGPTLQRLGYA